MDKIAAMKKMPVSQSPKKRGGQSLVELALSLMIILWLLAGAINFGMGFFCLAAIQDAAEEGALYGSLDPTTANIVARVQNSSDNPVDLSTAAVTVSVTLPASVCAGNPLTVKVTYALPVTTPMVGILTGSTISLTASATSIILKPAC